MEFLIDTAAHYIWDILGKPSKPSAKQMALRYKQVRGTFDKSVRTLGQYGWVKVEQNLKAGELRAYQMLAHPEIFIVLTVDARWTAFRTATNEQITTGLLRNLEPFLERNRKRLLREMTHAAGA